MLRMEAHCSWTLVYVRVSLLLNPGLCPWFLSHLRWNCWLHFEDECMCREVGWSDQTIQSVNTEAAFTVSMGIQCLFHHVGSAHSRQSGCSVNLAMSTNTRKSQALLKRVQRVLRKQMKWDPHWHRRGVCSPVGFCGSLVAAALCVFTKLSS